MHTLKHAVTPYPPDRFTIDATVALGSEVTLVAESKILDGELVGVEILSRDRMTRKGLGSQINQAEHVRALGDFIHDTLEAAARAVDELLKVDAAIPFAVNVPPHELTKYTVRRCAEVAVACASSMPYLEIEITEREPIRQEHMEHLHALHSLGYHLTLDDFGTEHAHFDLFERIPELQEVISTVKVDRMPQTDDVAGMVAELQKRGFAVVIEGVENIDTHGKHIADCITQGYAHGMSPTLAEFVDARVTQ